jgi:hypothetical protein
MADIYGMQVSYKIVRVIEGKWITQNPTDIVAWADVNGFSVYWPTPNLRLHPALQLQPRISELCGPMYDGLDANGLPVVRYEDQRSYNILSV